MYRKLCDCGRENVKGKTYCSTKCHLMAKIKMNETDCWEWQGKTNHQGYGRIKMQSGMKEVMAHRVSYETFVGVIPEGYFVCHKCDNPKCVNPSHLFSGTHTDNMRDCKEKGRNKYHIPKSEKSYTTKLTQEKVKKIRDLFSEGFSQTDIAKLYGVTQANIGYIVRGETWRDLS